MVGWYFIGVLFYKGICCFTLKSLIWVLRPPLVTFHMIILDATTQEHFRLPNKTFLLCVYLFGLPNNLIMGSAHVAHANLNCPLLICKQSCVSWRIDAGAPGLLGNLIRLILRGHWPCSDSTLIWFTAARLMGCSLKGRTTSKAPPADGEHRPGQWSNTPPQARERKETIPGIHRSCTQYLRA